MNIPVGDNDKSLCCGCGACALSCPRACIRMAGDAEGFAYPVVNLENCLGCGRCAGVCPMESGGYQNPLSLAEPQAYAARHNNPEILQKSTSGGAFSAIAAGFCHGEYAIFGAALCPDMAVRHRAVRDIAELPLMQKSKYVQSDLGRSYREAEELLHAGVKVLFSGTPCQVAGLMRFLGREYGNLLCAEVLCHGAPSPKVFARYREAMERRFRAPVERFDFRDKESFGWNIVMSARFQNGKRFARYMSDDPFGDVYLRSLCLRPSCHACPFARLPRAADVTLADFWGIADVLPRFDARGGASLVVVNTAQGAQAFEAARPFMAVEPVRLQDAIPYNRRFVTPAPPHARRGDFMRDVMRLPFDRAYRKYRVKRSFARRVLSRVLSGEMKKRLKDAFGRA